MSLGAWFLGAWDVTPSTDALNGLIQTDLFLLQKCLVSPITCSCTESIFKFCYVPGTMLDARGYSRKRIHKNPCLYGVYTLQNLKQQFSAVAAHSNHLESFNNYGRRPHSQEVRFNWLGIPMSVFIAKRFGAR